MNTDKNNKTIIYVMSDVRSGSTLLENILSNAPNTISVGELHHLDSHLYKGRWGKTWNWNCSCGKSITDCEFWKKVLHNLEKKNIKIEDTSIKHFRKNYDKTEKNKIIQHNSKTIKLINHIYTAIFKETNTNVIIDSSKHTDHGIMLYKNSDYKVKIIYLKRDIRAVVFSKARWAKKFSQKEKSNYNILRRSKIYDMNLKRKIKSIPEKDVISIRYEELANYPQLIINKIANKFGLEYFEVPEYMDFTNNHTIGGTPNRFVKSKIAYDNKWVKQSKRKPLFHIIGKLSDII